MKRLKLALVASWLALSVADTLSAATTTLTFNAPVPGTVTDTNGLGTGFTTRLPGTGSAIPVNDPNMDLLSNPGRLSLTSTHSNLGGLSLPGDNLPTAEAPGFFAAGVGAQDIQISAGFRDVHVLNGSDQISVYAAINGTENIRAGIHEQNRFIVSVNDGTGDVNEFTALGSFSTGDDIDVTLSRHAGLWGVSWHNLTNATSGSLPGVSVPWLDAQPNLSVGIHAADAGTTQTFVAQFDYFSVTVPEPGSIVLLGFGAVGLFIAARLSKHKREG